MRSRCTCASSPPSSPWSSIIVCRGRSPEIPTADILLDDATFASWFLTGADDATLTKYASTRSADLYFQYLPVSLLKLHCSDLASSTPHDQSLVMGYAFKSAYTVPEMEAKGLWSAVEAKIPTVGGCAALGYPMVPLH